MRVRLSILGVCLVALAMLVGGVARAQTTTTAPASQPAAQPAHAAAVVIGLDGEINDYTRHSIISRIEKAKAMGADTVILRLNTPGGLVLPALDISRYIKSQSDIRIVAYVNEMAYSAGAMIAMACDSIYMQPNSYIGDCAPIVPGEALAAAERAKAESPLLAEFRDSAIRNGYDPLLAQSMVQYGIVVHYIQNAAGERRFVEEAEYQNLIKDGWHAVEGIRNPVDGPNELLTLSTDEAGKVGISRGRYASPAALADAQQLRVLDTLDPGRGEELIALLNSYAVRGVIGSIFMLSLMAAFYVPGHGWAEVTALTALALMLGVPMLTGYAEWYEVLAILIGIVLLAIELFVIPGFGITGISGLVLIIGGLIMTFVPAEPSYPGILPSLPGTMTALKHGVMVIVGGMSCSLLLWFWLQRYLPKLPYFNRLILTTTSGNVNMADMDNSGVIATATWPAVGSLGRVVTDLRPGGTAAFHDPVLDDARIIDVVSDSGFVPAGTMVLAREVRGHHVVVRAKS